MFTSRNSWVFLGAQRCLVDGGSPRVSCNVNSSTGSGFQVFQAWLSHVFSPFVFVPIVPTVPTVFLTVPYLFPKFPNSDVPQFSAFSPMFLWFSYAFPSKKTPAAQRPASSKRCDRWAVNSSGRSCGTSGQGRLKWKWWHTSTTVGPPRWLS